MNATIPRQLMAGACVATLFVNVAFASDAGQLTKDKADKVHASKPMYSPYAGRNLPDAAALRRHAPAHRRSRWMRARSARG